MSSIHDNEKKKNNETKIAQPDVRSMLLTGMKLKAFYAKERIRFIEISSAIH